MRKGCLFSLLLFVFCKSFAVNKTWIGVSGGNWNNAGNWTPAGVPSAVDDVIFDASSVNVDFDISAFSINSLHFINNSIVVFQTSATRNFKLSSTSTTNEALLIEAGSSFTFDGINPGTNNSTIQLFNGIGVTGSIYGTLNISCTGGAASGPKLDTYNSITEYAILTVYNGGSIKILLEAGNTGSSLTPVPTLIMQNGSLYENLKNGGSFPAGTWQPTSLAKASSPGSNGPSFNGTAYGNLEWNCPAQTNLLFLNADISFNDVTFINTNNAPFRVKTGVSVAINTLTINGNLSVSNTSLLEITGSTVSSGSGAKIVLKGNLTNQGVISTLGGLGTINEFEQNGTSLQSITNTGTISGSQLDFILNNPAGATLLSNLVLPYRYTITSGNLSLGSNTFTTPSINQVGAATITTNHIVTDGSGVLKILAIGAGSVIFPIGPSASSYNPLTISNGNSVDYSCRVAVGISPAIAFPTYGINRTWNINASVVTPNLGVVFQYATADANAGASTQPQPMEILQNDGTAWSIITGNTNITPGGADPAFTIATATGLGISTTPTPYALGINGTSILPLDCIISAHSRRVNNNGIISWDINSCAEVNNFEIQRSVNGSVFQTIGRVTPGTPLEYSYTDMALSNGNNLYRIKVNRSSGTIKYSNTVAIINSTKGILITALSPNPVNGKALLIINTAKQTIANFTIYDITGRPVKQWQANIAEGSNNIMITTDGLSGGIYHLAAATADAKTVMRFVKQ